MLTFYVDVRSLMVSSSLILSFLMHLLIYFQTVIITEVCTFLPSIPSNNPILEGYDRFPSRDVSRVCHGIELFAQTYYDIA